jgi:hypothetical protein
MPRNVREICEWCPRSADLSPSIADDDITQQNHTTPSPFSTNDRRHDAVTLSFTSQHLDTALVRGVELTPSLLLTQQIWDTPMILGSP